MSKTTKSPKPTLVPPPATKKQKALNKKALVDRLLERYNAEADREYAEAFYGDMLRERGVAV